MTDAKDKPQPVKKQVEERRLATNRSNTKIIKKIADTAKYPPGGKK